MANPFAPIAQVEKATIEQLGRAADRLIAKCRKNVDALPKSALQQVLEEEGDELAQKMFEVLRKHVEQHTKILVRRVRVNRNLTPKQMTDAVGCETYIDTRILETIPRHGTGTEEFDMYFFNEGRYLTVDEQKEALAEHGLVPDYYGQIQVNIDDPTFANEYMNGAEWNIKDGEASMISFHTRFQDGYPLHCQSGIRGWHKSVWFAGRRPRK